MTIRIVYWSGTGNTKAMAEALAEGARSAGAEVELAEVGSANAQSVLAADAAALGCPSMGAEILEEEEMEPFVRGLESSGLKGKPLLLFGSYDWGDGQWMRDWEERMRKAGAALVGTGFIVNLTPSASDAAALVEAGRGLAAAASGK
jgi:flavodoxin short chain